MGSDRGPRAGPEGRAHDKMRKVQHAVRDLLQIFWEGRKEMKSTRCDVRTVKMSNAMHGVPVVRAMSQSFGIMLLLLTCGVLSAQNVSGTIVSERSRRATATTANSSGRSPACLKSAGSSSRFVTSLDAPKTVKVQGSGTRWSFPVCSTGHNLAVTPISAFLVS